MKTPIDAPERPRDAERQLPPHGRGSQGARRDRVDTVSAEISRSAIVVP